MTQASTQLSGSAVNSSASKNLLLSRISTAAFIAAVAVVGCVAIGLLFYAMPVWDDVIRATRPLELGWWSYVHFVYYHWQGRWASCGLESFLLPRVDIGHYYFLLIGGATIIEMVAAFVLCRWIAPRALRATAAMMAAGLLALLWAGMPSPAESVYWFTGAVENALVYALAVMLLVALDRLSDSGLIAAKRLPAVAGLSIAAICICGFHELYGGMLCLSLGIGCVTAFTGKKSDRSTWIVVTIAAAIGLGIVVAAPGNAVRAVTDGGPHAKHFGFDLHLAISQAAHAIPHWLLDPKLLAVSAWVFFSPTMGRCRVESSAAKLLRLLVPPSWLLVLAVGFFGPSWAFGRAMPPRTLSGMYIIFVLGWLANVHLWSGVIGELFIGTSPTFAPTGASIATFILSVSLLLFGNVRLAAREIHSRIVPWHHAIEKRYAMLRKEAGTDSVVPPLPKWPTLLLNGEVVNDPADYRNWGTVSYFHLRSIRVIPAEGPLPPPPDKPTMPPGKISQ